MPAVPFVAWPTLCTISRVISPCASTALDISIAIVEIWPIVVLTSLMAPIKSAVATRIPDIWAPISSVALAVFGRPGQTVHLLSRACRPSATPSSNSSFNHDLSNAHTAEDKSAKSNSVNKSAKVVLASSQHERGLKAAIDEPRGPRRASNLCSRAWSRMYRACMHRQPKTTPAIIHRLPRQYITDNRTMVRRMRLHELTASHWFV